MKIVGTGSSAPAKIMTNAEMATIVDTSDEWIVSRTGIHSRHYAVDETVLSLASAAAENALEAAGAAGAGAGVDRSDIALVICATLTAKRRCPACACLLQRDLGLPENILAFDLNAACSGFIFALITAESLLRPGQHALVIGSETLTAVTDFTDRSTCVLFGDGAGAVVLAHSDEPLAWVASTTGDDTALVVEKHVVMDGNAVFQFAVPTLVRNIQEVCAKAQADSAQVDLFICHQANERIIKSAARRLGIPLERFFMNLAEYGNTSAASIPLALDEAVRTGALHTGMRVVLAGFGGGLTSGAVYLEW